MQLLLTNSVIELKSKAYGISQVLLSKVADVLPFTITVYFFSVVSPLLETLYESSLVTRNFQNCAPYDPYTLLFIIIPNKNTIKNINIIGNIFLLSLLIFIKFPLLNNHSIIIIPYILFFYNIFIKKDIKKILYIFWRR